jgi:hypothetical protein
MLDKSNRILIPPATNFYDAPAADNLYHDNRDLLLTLLASVGFAGSLSAVISIELVSIYKATFNNKL